jgi:pimeloyl-ACP methyl ester carboxylesterase
MASGLSPEHTNPTGWMRRMAISSAAPFAEHFTVYIAGRRAGLVPGSTMSDLAADYAVAIENDIGQPVLLHGTSTGGSLALQLAIDHPGLIRRLVLASAACRLSERGRRIQADLARLTEGGDERRASALLMQSLAPRPLGYAARGVGWLAGGVFASEDPSDMLTTIAAEDSFDAEPALGRVAARTLVLGGTVDPFYTEDLFRRTASGVPDGRAVIFAGKSHLYAAGSGTANSLALGFLLGA